MKWFFVILLFGNALFFGWSYTQNLQRNELNADYGISTERADNSIALFSEMEQLPASHESAESDDWPSDKREQAPDKEKDKLTGPVAQGYDTDYEENISLLFDGLPDRETHDTVCHRLGPLSGDDEVASLLAWLRKHNMAYRVHSPEKEQTVSYWVYITPQKSVADLATLIQTLKEDGIDNYRLVRRGKMRNALSLGSYASIDQVDQQMARIKERGYDVIVVPQHSDTHVRWFDIRVESHMAQEDFLDPLMARDDRFVVECAQTTDWSS